jgi:hypothetical protein
LAWSNGSWGGRRVGWALTAVSTLLLVACTTKTIAPYSETIPPVVLATLADAGVDDLRARYRAAVCARLPAAARFCDQVLLRLPGETTASATATQPDLARRYRLVFVPGIFADWVVKVAGELMPQVSAERTAAIRQILDGVKAERRALVRDLGEQREAIFRDLEQRQEPLRSILTEVRATVDAGDRLSASVQTLLELARSMSPPEDGARPMSRPFDIREYQATADSATKTISQLNEMLLTARAMLESPAVVGTVSRLQTVVDQSRAEVQGVIDRAYRKGLALIVALAIALFVALTEARVVGTWLGARLAGPRRQEPS